MSAKRYNIIMADKRGDEMSPKTGRPTDNPKQERITVRLDNEASEIINEYCSQEKVERAEAVRRGIKLLGSKLKKEK